MVSSNELLISSADAEALSTVVGDRLEAEPTDALVEILTGAPVVPRENLPADRIAINSRVTYREEPAGARRTIVIVHPRESAPSDGRISVLSPVGRSLLGRRTGSSASIAIPGGRALAIRVIEVTQTDRALSREAA